MLIKLGGCRYVDEPPDIREIYDVRVTLILFKLMFLMVYSAWRNLGKIAVIYLKTQFSDECAFWIRTINRKISLKDLQFPQTPCQNCQPHAVPAKSKASVTFKR